MKASRRGRDWTPNPDRMEAEVADKTDNTSRLAPGAGGFVSFVGSSERFLSPTHAIQDHTFWSEDFGIWALKECLFSDRCFFSVKVLHESFCDWCIAQKTVGCMRETFDALLESEGFLIAGGLISGLMLKTDAAVIQLVPAANSRGGRN